MNSDRGVELRLCRTALECDGDALDGLAGIRPHHVGAEHTIRHLVDDELEQDLGAGASS